MTSNGHAKLADFGLGALTSSHQDGLIPTFAGTANFAAPEVLARRGGYAGGPADIWSLGTSFAVLKWEITLSLEGLLMVCLGQYGGLGCQIGSYFRGVGRWGGGYRRVS